MQIKLNDGTILEAVQVNGGGRFYQNAQRDTLEIVFDTSHSIDSLHAIFGDKSKTQSISLINDQGETYVHNDYVIQVETKCENVTLEQETSDSPAITVQRIKAIIAQLTYTEKLIEQLLAK